jgi:hypothetical protein
MGARCIKEPGRLRRLSVAEPLDPPDDRGAA